MKPLIRISRNLLDIALADLEREHPFAWERVGFFSCRQIARPSGVVLLCYDYHPVQDNHYIHDETCGARIGGTAIREAMQRVITCGSSQLWVHTHGRSRPTYPSRTDKSEGPEVVRSMLNVQPQSSHGWAVISESEISGQVSIPGKGLIEVADMVVVGWPMGIRRKTIGTAARQGTSAEFHSRQTFLGDDAPRVVTTAKLGVVGLGGGGSHISQQLAHLGFQNVVLVDHDRIEGSNLNRLVGATCKDVDQAALKVDIAERGYLAIQPHARLECLVGKWEQFAMELTDCDLIFGCLDGFAGRRDLERFCRTRLIPLIDIGMKVDQRGEWPTMYGQVAVSMPGFQCLRCLGVITDQNLGKEAADYGAGFQPQVVWPNGVLASSAVGFAMQLLTGWAGPSGPGLRLDYDGAKQTLQPSNLLSVLKNIPCSHFGANDLGDPVFRKL